MIDAFLNSIVQYLTRTNSMFSYEDKLYAIPLLIIVISFCVHLKKAFSKYHFTAIWCSYVLIAIVIEIIGMTKYCYELWDKQILISADALMWVIVMTVSGIITLISPMALKSAEKYYLKQMKK